MDCTNNRKAISVLQFEHLTWETLEAVLWTLTDYTMILVVFEEHERNASACAAPC